MTKKFTYSVILGNYLCSFLGKFDSSILLSICTCRGIKIRLFRFSPLWKNNCSQIFGKSTSGRPLQQRNAKTIVSKQNVTLVHVLNTVQSKVQLLHSILIAKFRIFLIFYQCKY